MHYRIDLSHRASKVYIEVYSLLKKVGVKSSALDSMLEHGGLLYKRKEYDMEDYKFRDVELTAANLYEFRDFKKVGRGIRKLVRHQGGESNTLQYSKLSDIFEKQIATGDFEQYHANLGTIKLKNGKAAEHFQSVRFEVEMIDRAYIMLYAVFSIGDSTAQCLEDNRLQEFTKGTIGLNFMPFVKRLKFSYSFKHSSKRLYDETLNECSIGVDAFLGRYIPNPLVSLQGLLTFYETRKKSEQVVEDFRKNRIDYSPIYNSQEKLYITHDSERKYIRTFIKTKDINIAPGAREYPSEFVDEFGSIFFYYAFQIFMYDVQSKIHKIILDLSRRASLSTLFEQSNQLTIQRYHIGNIKNLLNGSVWKRYIAWEKADNNAIARLNKHHGKPFDYSKEADELLRNIIQSSEQLVENAATKVKSESDIKNTSSNNRLSIIVLCVTALALGVAFITAFMTLYPRTTRSWICEEYVFYCDAKLLEDAQLEDGRAVGP